MMRHAFHTLKTSKNIPFTGNKMGHVAAPTQLNKI